MIELIYTSVTPERLSLSAIQDILASAQHNNRLNNITGHLFYDGQRFLQILEGAHETIYELYGIIEADSRHQNVELLYEQEIEARSFPDWQMAYEPLEGHSLNHPMRNIESINKAQDNEIESGTVLNFGAALFTIFRDSTITP